MRIHPNTLWRRRLDGRLARVTSADDNQVAFEHGPYRAVTTTRQFLGNHLLIDVHPTKKMLIRAALLAATTLADHLPLMALADVLEEQQDPDADHFRTLLAHSPRTAFALVCQWAGVIEW